MTGIEIASLVFIAINMALAVNNMITSFGKPESYAWFAGFCGWSVGLMWLLEAVSR